jgi:riboflavin biosynthesis pyrimidine reductase
VEGAAGVADGAGVSAATSAVAASEQRSAAERMRRIMTGVLGTTGTVTHQGPSTRTPKLAADKNREPVVGLKPAAVWDEGSD